MQPLRQSFQFAEQSNPDKRRVSSYAACLLRYAAQVTSVARLQCLIAPVGGHMMATMGFTIIIMSFMEL